jgi:transposase
MRPYVFILCGLYPYSDYMVYIKDLKNQEYLFPPNIKDLINDDHICFIVDTIIDSMDYSEKEKEAEGPGSPGYHPKIPLKVIIYGMIDGERSSRKLHENVKMNAIYIYLAGKLTPDFRTISDFRKDNPELVNSCFQSVVEFAYNLGMVSLRHISVDGTKIKANASKNRTFTKEELEFLEKMVKTEIEKGIEIDEQEDEMFGEDKTGYEMPDDVKLSKNIQRFLRKKLEEEGIKTKKQQSMGKIIKEHIEGDEKKKEQINHKLEDAVKVTQDPDVKKINLTDPDSNLMKNKKGAYEQCFNPQITVDSEEKIIIGNHVSQAPEDTNELIPMIDETEKNVGKLPEGTEISTDNGYYSGPNFKYFEDKKLEGYIPNSDQAQRMKGKTVKKDPFSKKCFEYDDENDVFRCPNNEILVFRHEYYDKGKKKTIRVYYTKNCKDCPYKQQCLNDSSKSYRRIKADKFEGFKKRMAKKMKSEEAREKLKIRSKIVEHPFGDIKQNMGLREFLLRGKNKVKIEFNLACIVHNIKRIASFIKKKKLNIGDIRKLVSV